MIRMAIPDEELVVSSNPFTAKLVRAESARRTKVASEEFVKCVLMHTG